MYEAEGEKKVVEKLEVFFYRQMGNFGVISG